MKRHIIPSFVNGASLRTYALGLDGRNVYYRLEGDYDEVFCDATIKYLNDCPDKNLYGRYVQDLGKST